MKEKVRPIYSELQGYLSQAPKLESTNVVFEKSIWEQNHLTIAELNDVTGENYDKFKVIVQPWASSETGYALSMVEYRTKLAGLIARLHAQFFSEEQAPFSGMPATTNIFNQSQQQTASFQVQLLLEMRDKIDEKIGEFPEDSKERTFLEKIKDGLKSVSNTSQLMALLLKTGNDIGLTIDEMLKIFG